MILLSSGFGCTHLYACRAAAAPRVEVYLYCLQTRAVKNSLLLELGIRERVIKSFASSQRKISRECQPFSGKSRRSQSRDGPGKCLVNYQTGKLAEKTNSLFLLWFWGYCWAMCWEVFDKACFRARKFRVSEGLALHNRFA